jgi:hypothetical protein
MSVMEAETKTSILRLRIPMTTAWGAIAGLILAAAAARGQTPAPAPARSLGAPSPNATIFVDPDVRVSYDGDVAHMEAYGAASTTNPNILLAGGELIFPGRALVVTETRLYRSADAGATWTPIPLPNEVNGGWDNAFVSGEENTSYFVTSNIERGPTVYSTLDGGKTWSSTVLAAAKNWDRPHLGVDRTNGPRRGRLYVAGEAGDGVRIMTSSDHGQTFTAPVLACAKPPGWNAATSASPMVLGDGTLVVPCLPYPSYPERSTWSDSEVGLVTSGDGGSTFTPFRRMGIEHRSLTGPMYEARVRGDVLMSGNFMQGPSFAAAPPEGPFPDRIYAAWQDFGPASGSHLLLSWSADRGASWSAPARVDSSRPGPGDASGPRQGVPMIGVNRDGVVGIAWFDTRSASDGKGYDVYFTASRDGGRTLLPPVRVSSATSRPARGQNIVPAPSLSKPAANGEVLVTMDSPFSMRATGGDYSSLAVDAAGHFHPFWADARSGTWQLYTATVRVFGDSGMSALTADAAASSGGPCAQDSERLGFLFGEPAWDASASEVTVPVRLRNNSPKTIAVPIRVEVSPTMPKGQWTKVLAGAADLVPRILDPSRAALGESATFVYPASISSPLFPNGVTAPLEWRLRVSTPEFMELAIRTRITTTGCSAK